ncbi:MAG TPA: acetamidase/formamidase family protein [Myxococcaceae bacterium]|nr:acetamidase/formamidase family protein [Myxococcaceae bacterium]
MDSCTSRSHIVPFAHVPIALIASIAIGVGVDPTNALAGSSGRYHLPSTPQTVYRGFFPRNAPPALTVPNGAIVRIDTLSHQGLNNRMDCTPSPGDLTPATCVENGQLDPIAFQGQYGVPPSEVLPDATDVFYKLDYPTRTRTGGGHVLTGPIYVEGAEPGDTLEVRIMRVDARVPWGWNTQGPGGALPGYLTESTRKLVRIRGNVALFSDDIHIPLKPFQGIMAVAPADDFVSPIPAEAKVGYVGSRPPGPMGGNMDLNDLGVGTSLYLPVFQRGAQFFTGDPHEVQGNGEVSGTALEQSNSVTMQFVVHKSGGLTGPRAETPTHYIFMGIDVSHDVALQLALRPALDFLQTEKGLSPADAMAFASLAVDLNIAEAVDFTNLVMARVPKLFFRGRPPQFWHQELLRVRTEAQRQGLEPLRHEHDDED